MNGQRLESVPMDGEMRRLIKRVKSIQVGGKPATVSWLAEQTGVSRNSVYAFLRGNIRRVQIVEAFRQLADKHAPATVAATQTLANVPHILIGGFSAHDIALIEQRVPERVIVARRGQSFAQWLRGDVTGTAELWPYLLVEDVQTATATPDEEALKSLGYL